MADLLPTQVAVLAGMSLVSTLLLTPGLRRSRPTVVAPAATAVGS
ncbi:hypothetical protein QQG74_19545 [Micromonospora sp. FIMYZ51]